MIEMLKRAVLLSSIAVLMVFSFSAAASAETTGYVTVLDGKNYEYDLSELADSYDYYLMDRNHELAALARHYLSGKVIAEIDSEKGYLDFEGLADAYDANMLVQYKDGSPATLPPETKVIKVVKRSGEPLDFGSETLIGQPDDDGFFVVAIR